VERNDCVLVNGIRKDVFTLFKCIESKDSDLFVFLRNDSLSKYNTVWFNNHVFKNVFYINKKKETKYICEHCKSYICVDVGDKNLNIKSIITILRIREPLIFQFFTLQTVFHNFHSPLSGKLYQMNSRLNFGVVLKILLSVIISNSH